MEYGLEALRKSVGEEIKAAFFDLGRVIIVFENGEGLSFNTFDSNVGAGGVGVFLGSRVLSSPSITVLRMPVDEIKNIVERRLKEIESKVAELSDLPDLLSPSREGA